MHNGGGFMKYGILLIAFCAGCLAASGEVSKDRLKALSRLVEIDGVECETSKNRSDVEYEVLTINFSSEESSLTEITARIAVELTDTHAKKTYLVTDSVRLRDPTKTSSTYTGEGYFELQIPHGTFEKLKTTAYAFELGVLDGKTFVPFDAKYKKVKTYEELTERTTTPFPETCRMGQSFWIEGNY
jgi:hypothetical protein